MNHDRKLHNRTTWLALAFAYAVTLATAVACSKFEVKKATTMVGGATKNGTARTVTTEPPGAPGPADLSMTVTNVSSGTQTTFNPDGSTHTSPRKSISADVVHGERRITFTVYPNVSPGATAEAPAIRIPDSARKREGDVEYNLQGFCGNLDCSVIAIMVTALNEKTRADFQQVELWDFLASDMTPKERIVKTAYFSVTDFWESVTGEKIPPFENELP